MTVQPIVIKATRYVCPFCSRGRAKKSTAIEHIERCWWNPANRTCKTCVNFEPAHDACGCNPGCNWGAPGPNPPHCLAGVDLDEDAPQVHCPSWEFPPEVAP